MGAISEDLSMKRGKESQENRKDTIMGAEIQTFANGGQEKEE
jgi:hypothetical protein